MGNHQPYSNYSSNNNLDKLQCDYLKLNKTYMRKLYLSCENNPYNISISTEKKHFDTITMMRTFNKPLNKNKRLHWKDYLLSYFSQYYDNGILWYGNIIETIEAKVFWNENDYLSRMFYKEYEIETKSKKLKTVENIIDQSIKEEEEEELQKLERHTRTTLSRVDLTQVTAHLGGSIISLENSFNFDEDPDMIFQSEKGSVKEYVKLFKQHIIEKDHPINKIIMIYENQLSYVIDVKIKELELMKNERDDNYESMCQDLTNEFMEHIKQFIIKIQSSIKLFYSKTVNLQCFLEEKDELINLVSTLLFKTGTLYEKIYGLLSLSMHNDVFAFEQKIIKLANISTSDLNINEKFRLDDSTKRFQEELKSNTDLSNLKMKCINTVSSSTDLSNENKVNNKQKRQLTIKSSFYERNCIEEYSTAITILRSIKYNNAPFEKMMLIASISSEIINCVNTFWKGMEDYITPTYLNLYIDDLVPVFIYLIIKTQMPQIIIHLKLIKEFTTKTTKTTTTFGYYTTTLEAAIEYILNNNIQNESTLNT